MVKKGNVWSLDYRNERLAYYRNRERPPLESSGIFYEILLAVLSLIAIFGLLFYLCFVFFGAIGIFFILCFVILIISIIIICYIYEKHKEKEKRRVFEEMVAKAPKIKCPICEKWLSIITEDQYKYSLKSNITRGLFIQWGVPISFKNRSYILCPYCNNYILQD